MLSFPYELSVQKSGKFWTNFPRLIANHKHFVLLRIPAKSVGVENRKKTAWYALSEWKSGSGNVLVCFELQVLEVRE